jgi:UPF0042 nucleotide-binding protein
MELVLITGMSGSGKSVALHALEDAGFYCVDNLPPELLLDFVALEKKHHATRVAIAMDVRSAASLPLVPKQLEQLRKDGISIKSLFLDASTSTLVRRYSETRRKHPLSQKGAGQASTDERRALGDAIELERTMLMAMREPSHIIDSSLLRSAQLQAYVKNLVASLADQLTLVFESFSFKRGVPTNADYVFDVRMLPNPHYEDSLRSLTGKDRPVADFLKDQASAQAMLEHIAGFLDHWLPALAQDHRSYVTVAIGCTGGQHRSVYLVECLAQRFSAQWPTLTRHRELDARSIP